MKVELFPFQKTALSKLRMSVATALGNYCSTHTPQVVSYTAPTGAGKTIVMASLIESIYYGDENYPDQVDAIFIWLSDSPQLNEQSKLKIDTKADKIGLNQCTIITDDSFDREMLEDGQIYFLNTQKLSKSSNLTKHYDGRNYTIWETLANTVREKSDRLYFIIDKAHRGAQKSTELARATTIMQKFLKGSEPDRLPPMPVVIGMTVTSARFNRLAEGIFSTTHYVRTTADEVRSSSLFKDRIVITYPETAGNDMAVPQAAADEWKNKWVHWAQYCQEQHYAYINPILVVQVQNGSGNRLSYTDLDECLHIIEERTGECFVEGEVVHAFGEGVTTIQINGLDVHYEEPSRISDNRRIKVVFFKETLSTGWDCPRAETMMSFRHANDHTYIAQLLGCMVRTPMQMHINVDDMLNDVHLYLPQFSAATVQDVVNDLQSTEGGSIPTDVYGEELGNASFDTLTIRPTYRAPIRQPAPKQDRSQIPGQTALQDMPGAVEAGFSPNDGAAGDPAGQASYATEPANQPASQPSGWNPGGDATIQEAFGRPGTLHITDNTQTSAHTDAPSSSAENAYDTGAAAGNVIDREGIVKAINGAGLLTYNVRKTRISDYLKSMFGLARFLTQTRIDMDASSNVIDAIVDMIHDYIQKLKQAGKYQSLADQVLQFKMNTQIFDIFGLTVDNYAIHDMFSTTDTDVDRQFRLAEVKLGNEGVGNRYGQIYFDPDDPIAYKIDVIVFAANEECMDGLHDFARTKFHSMNDKHRRRTVTLPDRFRKRYDDIVSDGDIMSAHNFHLPEIIRMTHETEGRVYTDHLFVDDSGSTIIKLNGWEEKVIQEEQQQKDFACWLRNPPRKSWSLCIPYDMGDEKRPTYPDFLIIRRDFNFGYIVDILEPHDPSRTDNLGKAKWFAEYARRNPGVGRIQLIRMDRDSLGRERPKRLDMSKSSVRDKVSRCTSDTELTHIFETDGFFM